MGENFDHANKMAKLLEARLSEKGIKAYFPVQSNMVFCIIEERVLSKLQASFDLKYWIKEKKLVRIATTFSTIEEDIIKLAEAIK